MRGVRFTDALHIATDAVIPKSRFGCPVHLSGFLTSKSMDGFSKARLVREIQAHGSFAER